MITLDFVSLLLSKDQPVQASTTLSPVLRDTVGVGTLGATLLGSSSSSLAQAQSLAKRQEATLVATGRKLLNIEHTVESVLDAAKRLQKEIALETRYWADVLSVSEGGWSVLRLQGDRNTLGVKFGFSEAAQEFRAGSVAPMRRAEDGSVLLECGRVGGTPQRLVVSVEMDGKLVGRSRMPSAPAEDAPLQAQVREARDSAFAQELWYEINREGRSMRSYGVQLEENAVSYVASDKTTFRFRLVSLEDERDDESRPQDGLAETISSALDLLLGHAHKGNNRRRQQLNAAPTNQRTTPPYMLLRPVLAYLTHEDSLRKTIAFTSKLVSTLQSAGLDSARYVLSEAPIAVPETISGEPLATSETLLMSLLAPLDSTLQLYLTTQSSLVITARTWLQPFIATQYRIGPPEAPSADAGDVPPSVEAGKVADNPLRTLYPPADVYPNRAELIYYLREATARAVAAEVSTHIGAWDAESTPRAGVAAADSDDNDTRQKKKAGWALDLSGTTLQCSQGGKQLEFDVVPAGTEQDEQGSALHVTIPSRAQRSSEEPIDNISAAEGDKAEDNGRAEAVRWTWLGHESGQVPTTPSLRDRIKNALESRLLA
jgi:mediator of RNA polymerase II transcription subunit 17, fungi type